MDNSFAAYVKHEKTLKNKDLRAILFAKDPHCHWCNRLVRNDYEVMKRDLRKGERYPDDMATIDHLYDRYDPINRYRVYKNWENKVLSCYRCNLNRAKEKTNTLPKEYLQQRMELGKLRRLNKDQTPRPLVLNAAVFGVAERPYSALRDTTDVSSGIDGTIAESETQ